MTQGGDITKGKRTVWEYDNFMNSIRLVRSLKGTIYF